MGTRYFADIGGCCTEIAVEAENRGWTQINADRDPAKTHGLRSWLGTDGGKTGKRDSGERARPRVSVPSVQLTGNILAMPGRVMT